MNFEIELPFLVQFSCNWNRDNRFTGRDGRKSPSFVEYRDRLDAIYTENVIFYIARFEVQVFGEELKASI
jgi:hypothetical protein